MNSLPSVIQKNEIASLLPHTGAMCLLDKALLLGEGAIIAQSKLGSCSTNPMSLSGQMSACAVLEYAAQCAAVQLALSGDLGSNWKEHWVYVVSAKELVLGAELMPKGFLYVHAQQISISELGCAYKFSAYCSDREQELGGHLNKKHDCSPISGRFILMASKD